MNFTQFQQWLKTNHPDASVTLVDNTHDDYSTIADNGGELTPKSVAVAVLTTKGQDGKTVAFELPQSFITDLQAVQKDKEASIDQIRGRVAILENGESVIHMRVDPNDSKKVEHLAGEPVKVGDIVRYSVKAEGDVVAFLEQSKDGALRPSASKLYVRTRSANAVTGKVTAEQLYAAQQGSKGQVEHIAAMRTAELKKAQAIGNLFGAVSTLLESGKVQSAAEISSFASLLNMSEEKQEQKAVA